MHQSDPKKKKKARPTNVPAIKGKEDLENSSPSSESTDDEKEIIERPDELEPKSVQQDHGGTKRIVNPGPEGEL